MKTTIAYAVQKKLPKGPSSKKWSSVSSNIDDISDAIAIMNCIQYDNPDMKLRIVKNVCITEVIAKKL